MMKSPSTDVLVVDDEDAIRQLLATALRHAGLTCDTAADGVEAVEQLTANQYSVVLLDLMMPRLDGIGVLQKLRSAPASAERPMIFIITAAMNHDELVAVGEMVQVVIRKPFDVLAVRNLVHDCVAARTSDSRPQRQPAV